IFQWLGEDESRNLAPEQLEHAGQEIGDVVLYLLLLCAELGLDMDEVVRAKLADTERRYRRGVTAISTPWRRASPRRSTAAPRAPSAWPCCRPTLPRCCPSGRCACWMWVPASAT